MRQKIVNLGRNNNGVIIEDMMNTDAQIPKFIMFNEKKRLMFPTIRLAKNYLIRQGVYKPERYHFHFNIDNGRIIDINDVYYAHDHFEYIDNNDIVYIIMQDASSKIISLDYMVFEGGDEIKISDKEEGREKSQRIMSAVISTLKEMFASDRYKINSIYRDRNHIITCDFSDSCTRFHFAKISELVKLNEARKNNSNTCLPFIKSMDRFLSLYCFSTTDNKNPYIKEAYPHLEKFMSDFIYIFDDKFPELDIGIKNIVVKGFLSY